VPGRDISIDRVGSGRPASRSVPVKIAEALVLVGIGVAIGTGITSSRRTTAASIATVTLTNPARRPPAHRPPASPAPTRASAAAVAAQSITAFDGEVLLHPSRVEAIVTRIASANSRKSLLAAFERASAQTREKLGAGTAPYPVVVLRSIPVGYRLVRYSAHEATVDVWYVGIVGSGATIQPQQSWRTQTVSLVWENNAWKVSSFATAAGPTPPLSTAEIPGTPAQLFGTIPLFKEFSSAAR
jgi:hypothetical protein